MTHIVANMGNIGVFATKLNNRIRGNIRVHESRREVKALEDKDIFKKLQSLDFSRFSSKHKEQLWQALDQRNSRRVLSEQELNISAAGIPELNVQKCDKCGSTDINGQDGKCDQCGNIQLP